MRRLISGCVSIPEEKVQALETLALSSAMEISALQDLMRDRGKVEPALFLAGSPAAQIEKRVEGLLGRSIASLDRYTGEK